MNLTLNYGKVKLDGLSVIGVAKIPGNISKGNWSLGMYMDAKADKKQRGALEAIFFGKAGGLMAQFTPLIKEFKGKGIEYVPIDFPVTDKKRRLKIGEAVDIQGGPYVGRMTPKGKVTQILNAPRVETGRGETLTTGVAKVSTVDAFGFDWDNSAEAVNTRRFIGVDRSNVATEIRTAKSIPWAPDYWT